MRPFRRPKPPPADDRGVVEITFPALWNTPPPVVLDVLYEAKVIATGDRVVVVAGVLQDGTNLLALTYPGGQRSVRMSPLTGWAIEERIDGRELDLATDEPIRNAWRMFLNGMIDAKHRAGLGPEPC